MAQMMDVKPTPYCRQIRCDRCGAEAGLDDHEFHLFASLAFDATWGSPLGDGNHVAIDLCHRCLKETLGPWLSIRRSDWCCGALDTSP